MNIRTFFIPSLLIVLLLTGCGASEEKQTSDTDQGSRVRFSLPTGWEVDTEFIEAIMADDQDLEEIGATTIFGGGKPVVGGYDPNLVVITALVPRNTDLKEFIDGELPLMEEDGATVDWRKTSSLAGFSTDVVMFDVSEAASSGFGPDSRLEQTYFIKGMRLHIVQCASGRASAKDFDLCRDTVKTLEFYK